MRVWGRFNLFTATFANFVYVSGYLQITIFLVVEKDQCPDQNYSLTKQVEQTTEEDSNIRQAKKQTVVQKSFQCHICCKEFAASFSLNRHIMTMHLGEFMFACSKCDKKFNRMDALNNHMLVHADKQQKTHSISDYQIMKS